MSRRLAYCIIPGIGGTYRFFTALEAYAEQFGWKAYGVSVGKELAQWDPDYANDSCVGIAPEATSMRDGAKALAQWVEDNRIDVLMPMSSHYGAAVIPHLPESCKTVMRCNNTTRHTYQIVELHAEHTEAIAATTPRQRDDLIRRGTPKSKITLIPHGTMIQPSEGTRPPLENGLQLCFVGRLENYAKGIFLLPSILEQLGELGVKFELTIAGDGPDRAELEQRLSKLSCAEKVKFLGAVPHSKVVEVFGRSHVMLMPSHFEGFGFSLIESMASGCVPVASRLDGVTDSIVTDSADGRLASPGNSNEFSQAVLDLVTSPSDWESASAAGIETVKQRFSAEQMTRAYTGLFDRVVQSPASRTRAEWNKFQEPAVFRPTWRRWVPEWTKVFARQMMGRQH